MDCGGAYICVVWSNGHQCSLGLQSVGNFVRINFQQTSMGFFQTLSQTDVETHAHTVNEMGLAVAVAVAYI